MASDDAALRRLLDERAIAEVLARYCRGVDRMDRDLVRSCYHADATDEHGSFRGSIDEYLEWAFRLLARYTSTMHFLGNRLIEFHPERDDVARAETYGIAFHRTEGGGARENLVTGFRYVDRFECRPPAGHTEPEWRIAARVAITEWVSVDVPEHQWPIPDGMRRGARDRTDTVYRGWDD
jgi:hypothetical protein